MEIKLAEALLRRKELMAKVDSISHIKQADIYEIIMERRNISEAVDDINAKVPKLELNQVTAEYDFYSRQLRLVDAAIQQANWTTGIEVKNTVMDDYKSK